MNEIQKIRYSQCKNFEQTIEVFLICGTCRTFDRIKVHLGV